METITKNRPREKQKNSAQELGWMLNSVTMQPHSRWNKGNHNLKGQELQDRIQISSLPAFRECSKWESSRGH